MTDTSQPFWSAMKISHMAKAEGSLLVIQKDKDVMDKQEVKLAIKST